MHMALGPARPVLPVVEPLASWVQCPVVCFVGGVKEHPSVFFGFIFPGLRSLRENTGPRMEVQPSLQPELWSHAGCTKARPQSCP